MADFLFLLFFDFLNFIQTSVTFLSDIWTWRTEASLHENSKFEELSSSPTVALLLIVATIELKLFNTINRDENSLFQQPILSIYTCFVLS